MSGRKCAVLDCMSYGMLTFSKSFHRFPRNLELCKKWIQASGRSDISDVLKTQGVLKVNRGYLICSDHFNNEDYINPESKTQGLKTNTVPTLNLPILNKLAPSKLQGRKANVTDVKQSQPSELIPVDVKNHNASAAVLGENRLSTTDATEKQMPKTTLNLDKQEIITKNSHCRTCLSKNYIAYNVFSKMKVFDFKSIIEVLTDLFSLKHPRRYPNYVCTRCYIKLVQLLEFKNQALLSETALDRYYDDSYDPLVAMAADPLQIEPVNSPVPQAIVVNNSVPFDCDDADDSKTQHSGYGDDPKFTQDGDDVISVASTQHDEEETKSLVLKEVELTDIDDSDEQDALNPRDVARNSAIDITLKTRSSDLDSLLKAKYIKSKSEECNPIYFKTCIQDENNSSKQVLLKVVSLDEFNDKKLSHTIKSKMKKKSPSWECKKCGINFENIEFLCHHISYNHNYLKNLSEMGDEIPIPKKSGDAEDNLQDTTTLNPGPFKVKRLQLFSDTDRKTTPDTLVKENCPFCESDVVKEHLARHIREDHEDEHRNLQNEKMKRRLKCDECNKRFIHYSALLRHTKKFHSIEYRCPICLSLFQSKLEMRNHQREEHLQEPHEHETTSTVLCHVCGMSLKPGSVSSHMLKHTTTRKWRCTVDGCNSKFKSMSALRIHKHNIHEKRSLICEKCGKSVASISALRLHKRIHLDVKPYCCNICGLGFAVPSKLKSHVLRIHQKLKQYSCPVCAKVYTTSYVAKKHCQKFHPSYVFPDKYEDVV